MGVVQNGVVITGGYKNWGFRGKFGVHDIFVKPDLRLKPCSVVMIFF